MDASQHCLPVSGPPHVSDKWTSLKRRECRLEYVTLYINHLNEVRSMKLVMWRSICLCTSISDLITERSYMSNCLSHTFGSLRPIRCVALLDSPGPLGLLTEHPFNAFQLTVFCVFNLAFIFIIISSSHFFLSCFLLSLHFPLYSPIIAVK
jgi:hypothetical protein